MILCFFRCLHSYVSMRQEKRYRRGFDVKQEKYFDKFKIFFLSFLFDLEGHGSRKGKGSNGAVQAI
jgi:hypothetical protein